MLFDLVNENGKSNDVAAQHPKITAQLMEHVDWARGDIGGFDRIGKM